MLWRQIADRVQGDLDPHDQRIQADAQVSQIALRGCSHGHDRPIDSPVEVIQRLAGMFSSGQNGQVFSAFCCQVQIIQRLIGLIEYQSPAGLLSEILQREQDIARSKRPESSQRRLHARAGYQRYDNDQGCKNQESSHGILQSLPG